MDGFIGIPVEFGKRGSSIHLKRNLEDRIAVLDNLIELIVFTPKGSFPADPEFGFEYWNHEYSNVHFRNFNIGHASAIGGLYNDVTRKECQDSVRKSLETYAPALKNVEVAIELNPIEAGRQYRKVMSRYEVAVRVSGILDGGLGVLSPYNKSVSFYMEPTVRKAGV